MRYAAFVLQLLAGLALVAATLAAARTSEAADLLRFPLAWSGVLLALDGLVQLRHGKRTSARDLLAAGALSVVFWDLFELLNLRLQNWWYVGLAHSGAAGSAFALASFATVLPAVRLGFAALSQPGEPPLRGLAPKRPATLALLGLLALALPLLWPRIFFGCAWLFLWPLCEAAAALLPIGALPTPLEAWRAGDRRVALRLLLLALPLGLLWESLNAGCERGWFYTVPFFERPKLFEMPLPGYLGYLPFLLEAGAALSLLERTLRAFPRLQGRAALAGVLAFHFAADGLSRPRTGISYAPMQPGLARVGFLGDGWAARLRKAGIADAAALAGADAKSLRERLGPDAPPDAILRLWIAKARSR